MDAGRLRHRLTLQRPAHESDDAGDQATAWVDVAKVWAAIEPLSGREWFAAMQYQSAVTHKITIRYRGDVKASWRLKYGCREFSIDGAPINPDERNQWLVLNAVEVTK